MEDIEKEYYVQWIIADHTPFEYSDKKYFLSTPFRENKFFAERLFISTYNDCIQNGLLEEGGIFKLLLKYQLWDREKESNLQKMILEIEDIKVRIFENYTHTSKRKDYKKALTDTKNYIEALLQSKQSFDTYSAKTVAQLAKQHFLLGSSIFKAKGKPLWKNWWNSRDDDIVQHCYEVISEYSLTDSDYRELARSSVWRHIWSSRKSVGNLFGRAAVDLSSQQRQLVMWSNMYDNVYKNSECPSDSVVEDDDALDGWMIKQKRLRDKANNKNSIENSLTNDRIRNSDHVYVMCDPEDVHKVYDCNDFEGKMRFNRIMNQIKQEGCVSYMDLKDTQMDMLRKANEMKG